MIERVPIGETYISVNPFGELEYHIENGSVEDDWLFEWGNYFLTEDQAFAMQKELIGVLLFNN